MALLSPGHVETPWLAAVAIAALAHAAAIGAVLVVQADAAAPPPEPVMVIELPAGAAPAAALAPQPSETIEPLQELPASVVPRLEVPEVDAPLPPDPVTLPTPRPLARNLVAPSPRPAPAAQPAAAPPAPRLAPATPAAGSAAQGGGPGESAAARDEEADWYALVSAHLERNKRYPREAKAAEQQGTPTVRFSVDRRGRVTDIAISRSSGHALLDRATLELLRRVSPLPAMPRSMGRERVVISLPIEYSLSRK